MIIKIVYLQKLLLRFQNSNFLQERFLQICKIVITSITWIKGQFWFSFLSEGYWKETRRWNGLWSYKKYFKIYMVCTFTFNNVTDIFAPSRRQNRQSLQSIRAVVFVSIMQMALSLYSAWTTHVADTFLKVLLDSIE